MTLCYGKLPARQLFGVADLDSYLAGRPPIPPAEVKAPFVGDWQMFANDRLGDCTIAGAAHLVMASDRQLGRSDPVPADAEVVAQYEALTGGQDTGCVEADVLATWRTSGLFGAGQPGNRIAAYAPVPVGSILALQRAIYLFGAAYLGVQCPASAQQQFLVGQPWTVVPGSPIEGGHAILAVGYEPAGLLCVSWGALVTVTWPWVATYLDEAWAIISQEVAEAGHGPGPGLDLAALTADLDRLGA